jgi:hypothetical protein
MQQSPESFPQRRKDEQADLKKVFLLIYIASTLCAFAGDIS